MNGPFRLQPPPRATENDIERACLDLLRLRGYWIARLHAGRYKTLDGKRWIAGVERGTPDYAAIHARHRGFLLEVKRPGESPTPEQILKHRDLRLGYEIAIAVIDDAAQLVAWLERHEQTRP